MQQTVSIELESLHENLIRPEYISQGFKTC